MSLAEFLEAVIRLLDDARIPGMLTGSLAAAHYANPRATQDIDLVIDASPQQIDRFVDGLLAACLYVDRGAAVRSLPSPPPRVVSAESVGEMVARCGRETLGR